VKQLADALEAHRQRMGSYSARSQGGTGKPLNLDNLVKRAIVPALSRCTVCKKQEDEHKPEGRLLPVIPELDHTVDEVVSIRYGPRRVESIPQQVVLLVRGHEVAAILRTVEPLQDVQKDVLIVANELGIRHVVEQAFNLAAMFLTVPAAAQQAVPPPTLTATQLAGHILSAETHSSHGTNSSYNQATGKWSHGSSNAVESATEIQVGNLVYESPRIHKEVQVGKDYPVNIEIDKHGVAKKLDVMVGEKKYTYRVTGTRETKSN
jgi:hypothetical protein